MDPTRMTDDQLARAVATLDGDTLSDLLVAVDAAEIVARQRPVVMAEAASWYAQTLRWPVFPIVARGKRPLTTHGFKDATTDLEQISAWWTTWPDATIGTPTGAREQGGCGYDVIDVDGRTGLRTLARLKHTDCPPDCTAVTFCAAQGEIPPLHAHAWTPGGDDGPGRHLFITATGDGNATAYEPGLDYRGVGGYVVLAPSIGMTGSRYTWLTRPAVPA
jgi:hypothetical protein